MANTPVLTDEQWGALRLLSIKGISDVELSEQFNVDGGTIRQKRHRDEIWQAAWEGIRGKGNEKSQKGPETASLSEKVASTISGSIASLSENNLLLASRIAQRGLQRANSEFDAIPIENMGDVERIFKMAAMAGKWNAPQLEIKQAFAFGGGRDDETILECDTVVAEDSGAYDDGFDGA